MELHRNLRPFLETPGLRGEGLLQCQLVQCSRAKIGGDALDRLDGLINQLRSRHRPVEERVQLLWNTRAGQPVFQPANIQLDPGQQLAEFIVNEAGTVGALDFLGTPQARGKGPELLLRFPGHSSAAFCSEMSRCVPQQQV